MKKINLAICIIFSTLIFCYSCEEEKKTKETKGEVAVQVDSSAFKIEKDEIKDFSIVKEEAPSSKSEVEKLVNTEDVSELNKYQLFAQDFIKACANKNYSSASKFLAYNGLDESRINKESFNYTNTAEQNVVKVTTDVVFTFLAESKDYKFISSKEKLDKLGQKYHELEITFFKKGIGVNRRYFEIIDTSNGMLISNMR